MSENRLLQPPPLLRLSGLPVALQALLIHAAAWLLVIAGFWTFVPFLHPLPDPILAQPAFTLAILEGVVAALFSRLAGMPSWWPLINGLFFPAIAAATFLNIAPGWYLAGFALLALTSLGAVITRVPLYLSSDQAHEEVARRLPDTPNPRVIDLGSGLGGLLAHLARVRPDSVLAGIDAAPLPWLFSTLRLAGRARIGLGSLWDRDLSAYDVVYAYLSPAPMPRLWEKVQREMRPGSLFISNTFSVPDVAPDETVELHDLSRARLLIWRIR